MKKKELHRFIDLQKSSSWCSVEEGKANGKTVRVAFSARHVNYEKYLHNMIDADKRREKRCNRNKFKKSS